MSFARRVLKPGELHSHLLPSPKRKGKKYTKVKGQMTNFRAQHNVLANPI